MWVAGFSFPSPWLSFTSPSALLTFRAFDAGAVHIFMESPMWKEAGRRVLSYLLGLRSELTLQMHREGFLMSVLVTGWWDGAFWQSANPCRFKHITVHTQNLSW